MKFLHSNYKSLCYIARCYSLQKQVNFFDIIISGGGLIGQTMACSLIKNPLLKRFSILLIEGGSEKVYYGQDYSNRVSSIVPSTKKLLVKLEMWEHIKRYQVMKDMKVWGYLSNDYTHFNNEHEASTYIIENDEIVNAAVLENQKEKNLKILYGNGIKKVHLDFEPGSHGLELEDGSVYNTNLLIGADGANSLIRSAMDTNYISWKYGQFGIVATLKLVEEAENFTAWQRFLPDGPVALLPLQNGISSLVWSVSEKKAHDLLKLPEEHFVDALNDALHSEPERDRMVNNVNILSKSLFDTLGVKLNSMPLTVPYVQSIVKNSRAGFPLGFGHSSQYYKPGVVLVGDAAHKVHPLAGQGVNIGFRDIQNLEEKLSQGLLDGRDLGHSTDLRNYESEAQRNNLPIMAAIDLLHKVYTSNNNFVKAFANSSFHITESVGPVKAIMKHLATR